MFIRGLMIATALVAITSATAHAATPALVQSASKEIIKERKISRAAFTTPNTAGNLIVVYHVLDNTDGVTTTDTAGNNYQTCGVKTIFNNGANMAQIDYAANIKGGANTVQANYLTTIRRPGARFGRMFVHEFSGLDTTNPCLAATSAINTGTSINSGNVTATAKDQLVFGAITSSVGQPTIGAGMSALLSASNGLTEMKLTTGAGSVSAAAATPSGNNVAHVALFKQKDTVIPPDECTTTVKKGSDIVKTIMSAAPGTTLCLEAGEYGTGATQNQLLNTSKSSPVTIRSLSGKTATLYLDLYNSSNYIFKDLTVSGMFIRNGSKNIKILNNTFTDQLHINMGSNGGNYSNANILVDGNTFDGIDVCNSCGEGRVYVVSDLPAGVTISNNYFRDGGDSDGIQTAANGLVIGPGNVFDGISQGNNQRHVDAIQGYGQKNTIITGNYFVNGTVYVGFYDGGENETITNNIFGPSVEPEQKLQLGSLQGLMFTHNTVKGDYYIGQGGTRDGRPQSRNIVYRNNLFDGTSVHDVGDVPGCATGCVYENNMFSKAANARGVNNIIGAPTYVGGTNPTTQAGYKLAPTSLGVGKGTDGKDMGSNNF